MRQSKEAEEMMKLMNIVEKVVISEEEIADPNSTTGPGSISRKTKNDYTREEVKALLDYARTMVNDGKQLESWEKGQDWLNAVGNAMKRFVNLKKGDPALDYEEGKQGGDVLSWSYTFNKKQ